MNRREYFLRTGIYKVNHFGTLQVKGLKPGGDFMAFNPFLQVPSPSFDAGT